jgi:DNA-binding transcriptional MocR family regulator
LDKLYEQIASHIANQIDQGVYRPGDRIPGIRKLSRHFGVSITTVVQAQQLLEDQGRIEARPRSGYYVRTRLWNPPQTPSISSPTPDPTPVSGQELALRLVQATNEPDVIQLGAAVPHTSFLATTALNRAISTASRRYPERSAGYEFPPGSQELRRQIARRMVDAGCQLGPDDIITTSGCQEAVTLCLRAIAQQGDIVAIESPTFYGLLQVIESLGMKALEIPTDPQLGISLDALQLALEQWQIKACVAVTNFSNPLGYCMPEEKKQSLVRLLAKHQVPLIEDDVYGDLGFSANRPFAAKAYDTQGDVLYCSSFSKTLSPGLRIGWVVPGKYYKKIEYLKYVTNLAAPTLPQLAIADFLDHGGYDRYLRQVRGDYARAVAKMTQVVSKYFPEGTKVTRPEGGFVIWIELPAEIDSVKLYQLAIKQRISIAPGPMFSATQKYQNFIRLNCALPWSERLDWAVMTIGRLASSMLP